MPRFESCARLLGRALIALIVTMLVVTGAIGGATFAHAQGAASSQAAERGARLFWAAGGCGCHTDRAQGGAEMAGGRAIATPFGTFYSTNITPDPQTGIGNWSDADFVRAMRQGIGPQGQHYFPVFPYPAFSGMTDPDLRDLKAYLFSLPAVRQPNRPHDVPPPFAWRWSVGFWKWLNFTRWEHVPDPSRSAAWNRGAYLVRALGHCGECHTPRNLLGGSRDSMWLAGARDGPEGELAPNITPDADTGIGEWSVADIAWFLETGLKPDGDDTQGLMAEAIEHGYAHLPGADREAIAAYLLTVPAISNRVQAEPGE